MTAPVVYVERTERSAYFAGDLGVVHAAIRMAGCRKQYDPSRHALGVPRAAADDVEAALELSFGVDVRQVETA